MKTLNFLLLARLAILLVLLWNVQCALAFLFWPERFALSFELTGAAGEAAVRGVGLVFLMWNVPYAVALWHPLRHRISLYEASAMQAIGLLGESIILAVPAARSCHAASQPAALHRLRWRRADPVTSGGLAGSPVRQPALCRSPAAVF